MTGPYGIDPEDPCADILLALHRERYGTTRELDRERFSPVIGRRPAPTVPPISDETAALHRAELAAALDGDDDEMRGHVV